MDIVYDPLTGQRIHASSSSAYRGKDYICPCCQAPVRLRKGFQKAPYFAHLKGKASPTCELYVSMMGNGDLSSGIRERSYRDLGLYLRILDQQKKSFSWHLEIGIPESEMLQGLLRFPFAWEGERVIPVKSIRQGGIRVRIRPRKDSYRIIGEQLPKHHWSDRVILPVSGLKENEVSVFHHSYNGGRKFSDKQPLYWGRRYVLFWYLTVDPSNLPDKIVDGSLKYIDQWTGAVIKLPPSYDRDIDFWASRILQRKILYPPAEITLINPLPEQQLLDESLIVCSESEVVIGIIGQEGSQRWSKVNIATPDYKIFTTIKGDGTVPTFFSLGKLPIGRIDIWLDDDFDSGIQLLISSPSLPKLIPGIEMQVETVEGKSLSFSLLSNKVKDIIELVRQDSARLISFTKPDCVPVFIKWRISNEEEWHEKEFDSPEEIVSQIKEILIHKRFSLIIDAKGYGYINISSYYSQSQSSLKMSFNWRQRARWVLSLSRLQLVGTSVLNTRLIFSLQKSISIFEKEDQFLLKELFSSNGTYPSAVDPQMRALYNEYLCVCLNDIRNS